MNRRKSLIVAGAVAGSLFAASTAYALTSGIIDNSNGDGAGTLSPVVDAPASPDAQPPAAPSVTRTDDAPVTTSTASDVGRSGDDDDEHESEHEIEFEGADDDD
jgi:hypothetical protein